MIWKRTELLFGKDNMEKLHQSHVLLFGLGGVGGYALEALVRSGVGNISIVDFDRVDITNCNRQILATQKSLGQLKTEVAIERAKSISPEICIRSFTQRASAENIESFFENIDYDYVIDAIDTVSAKIALIEYCFFHKIPIISAMGTARKWDPTKLVVTDIHKTSVCPLARVLRRELKKRGVKKCKVVYSTEEAKDLEEGTLGSTAFVPSVAGLFLAAEVVKDLCQLT